MVKLKKKKESLITISYHQAPPLLGPQVGKMTRIWEISAIENYLQLTAMDPWHLVICLKLEPVHY